MEECTDSTDYTPHFEVLNDAQHFFRTNLAGSPAETYLRERGVTDASMEVWQLGYAPDAPTALFRHLHVNYSSKIMEEGGLITSPNEEGKVRDSFRHRTMFPLFNQRGNTIGFTGRRLRETDFPKYTNSSENELFNKASFLYGWERNAATIQKNNRVILVEGALDVILSHQSGIQDCVATLGTVLNENQSVRIDTLIPEGAFVLCFDNDDAGRRATYRALESLHGREHVFVCTLPPGYKDPAEVCASGDSLERYIESARPALDVYLDIVLVGRDPRSITRETALIRKLASALVQIPRERRNVAFDKVEEKTGLERGLIECAIDDGS